ncbi:MAG TPA: dihydrofolate reductase, partial [Vampirovibrionales bacterium]
NLNVLGSTKNNLMLWRNKQDLKFFKSVSQQYTNIVTKATFSSMPKLQDRQFLVTTKTPILENEYTFEQIKAIIEKHEKPHLCIGGLTLYKELLPLTDHFILCKVNNNIQGDILLDESLLLNFAQKQNIYNSKSYNIDLYSHLNTTLTLNKTWN